MRFLKIFKKVTLIVFFLISFHSYKVAARRILKSDGMKMILMKYYKVDFLLGLSLPKGDHPPSPNPETHG